LFLRHYAYERSGAPRGSRIAAVKAVSLAWPDLSRVPALFAHFYGGKRNEPNNPAFDPALVNLDIPALVATVEAGNLRDAFRMLRLRGIGPKIRTFFLRDAVTTTQSESHLLSLEDYLYCQPVGIWVLKTVTALDLPVPASNSLRPWRELEFDDADGAVAVALTSAALDAHVSPVRVNQSIWYFCANAVADVPHLDALLRQRDPAALDRVLALLED
jgi:hypothetical protein